MDAFLEASRLKVRFITHLGLLTVEDLWDLPLTGKRANLDAIAIDLAKQLRETNESFVDTTRRTDPELHIKFNVVKAIIDIRLAERDAAKLAKDKAERKQKILAIIERKQDQALEASSLEELNAALAAL